jgi:hypothetical protein
MRRGPWSVSAWACIVLAASGILSPGRAAAQYSPTIRHIRLERENVFEDVRTSFLGQLADALHAVTRDEVILRELLFREGAPLDREKIAETERNLRRQHIFRSVEIRVEAVGSDQVDVVVRTRDSWTTQVGGSIGREGGRSRFGLALEDNNFLGTGKKLSVAFEAGPDRTTREVSFADPQFLGRRLSLDLLYGTSTDGERRRLRLERPFRSLDSASAATLLLDDAAREARIYAEGSETDRFSLRERRFELSGARRLTLSGSRPVARLFGGYRREEASFAPAADGSSGPLPDSRRFGFFFTRLELTRPDFEVERGVAFLSRDEDFDLGGGVALEVGYSPAILGADSALEGALHLEKGVRFPNGFLRGSVALSTRSREGTLENTLATGELFAVWRPAPESRHTAVARTLFAWGDRLDPEIQLAADGATGLRGYRLHAFTGDRRLIFNVEDRIRITPELFHLIELGAAVFLDGGYAWPGGQPVRLSDLRYDVGAGLRIGLPRASRHSLLRLDLAYALRPDWRGRRGWLFSFSSSQAF